MDQIRIENLEVYAHHGVLKEENTLGQKFLVSLILFTDTAKAGRSDNLSFSVDYADVAHFAEKQMKEKEYKLIESAAENLAEQILLQFPLIDMISVEIRKPWAPILLPLDHVSVKIQRGWTRVYLSVGSNMGDKEENIEKAVQALREDRRIRRVTESTRIQTKPYGYTEQDDFLKSMAEAGKAVSDSLDNGKNIVYVNVMNNLSVDCDCNGYPAKPKMKDVGILASDDPVALDHACVDLVYKQKNGDGASLVKRIESRNGLHTLEYAEEIGLGKRDYKIVSID